MTEQYSDDEIVRMIQSGGHERMVALKYLYLDKKVRIGIRSMVKGKSPEVEFDDILQESFIILDRSIRNNRYKGNSSIRTYIIGIAKWMTIGKLRKVRNTVQDEPMMEGITEEPVWSDLTFPDDRLILIHQLISQMGERCQQLIRLWSESVSMQEIAGETGITDARAAKKEVFRCREKLKKLIQNHNGEDK